MTSDISCVFILFGFIASVLIDRYPWRFAGPLVLAESGNRRSCQICFSRRKQLWRQATFLVAYNPNKKLPFDFTALISVR